jgi:Acyclic terpene utilisation family protein AtuA
VTGRQDVKRPVRIANCSGFYGDRLTAAAEMVDGGPIDVLTGDWLAELTMLILAKNRQRDPSGGYARTFVTQMEQVMATCLERGIRVVSNAGGLAPRACAEALQRVARTLGVDPVIAIVEGDDLVGRIGELRAAGVTFQHLDTGAPLGHREVTTANAYLGGWGIATALDEGADIVVTGRVSDAALVIGPAAWYHGWRRGDWDQLAGALVAGHILECGAQATGGNYAFFEEVGDLRHPGFPIAEIAADGSSVITKHPGHGGLVSVGTVTAQLLYEIGGPEYVNPDVTARFDTVNLEQRGQDRVGVSGVRGLPPPATLKVALNLDGGWRTTMTLWLVGLDIEAKAQVFLDALWSSIDGGAGAFDEVDVVLVRGDHEDATTNEGAMAQLRVTVKDADEKKVGRAFADKVIELGLANYPGFFGASPARAQGYGVYWPAAVPANAVHHEVVIGDRRLTVAPTPLDALDLAAPASPARPADVVLEGPSVRMALGRVMGARSGDKGGNANLGVWVRSPAAYAWLRSYLSVERLAELLPETACLEVRRYEFANLLALNFVIVGLLGEGVASTTRFDAQAKSLGEWLRSRLVDVPEELVNQ